MTAKKKTKQTDNKVLRFIKKRRKGITEIIIALLVLYVIGLINPITGPALRYPYYVVYCGQKPVIASDFTGSYVMPDMNRYDYMSKLGKKLYCTEGEAIANGYSSSNPRQY